jgi:hypothetical protein
MVACSETISAFWLSLGNKLITKVFPMDSLGSDSFSTRAQDRMQITSKLTGRSRVADSSNIQVQVPEVSPIKVGIQIEQ